MQPLFVVFLVPNLITVIELIDLLLEVGVGHAWLIIIVIEVTIVEQASTVIVSITAVAGSVSDGWTSDEISAHLDFVVMITFMVGVMI